MRIRSLLCIGVFTMTLAGPAFGQTATVELAYPEGRTAVYKNKFSLRFTSDSADKLLTGRDTQGRVMAVGRGEWMSTEVPYSEISSMEDSLKEGERGVLATISDADNSLEFQGQRLTSSKIPNPFTELNDKKFAWRFNGEGEVLSFHPRFRIYQLSNRGMIAELYQLWMPGFCPLYPEGEVAKGDTWSDEQTLLEGANAQVKIASTYEVKKVEEDDGAIIVELEEERQVEYTYLLNGGAFAVVLSGAGEGKGEWKIDTSNGVVLEHESEVEIERPAVMKPGTLEVIPEVRANLRLTFKRELDDLKE